MVRLSCPKSITEDRVVGLSKPTKPYSDVMTNLTLAPFQQLQPGKAGVFHRGRSRVAPYEGDSPGWMRSRG
jgi:hypothetical protein